MVGGTYRRIAVAFFAIFLIYPANAWWFFRGADFGFHINMSADNGVGHSSGDSAQISGQICKVSKFSFLKKAICFPLPSKDLEVRAFFPDLTNEVTLTLDKKERFSFVSPSLNNDDVNALTIVVGKIDPKVRILQKIKSKLDKRIVKINILLDRLIDEGVSPKRIDKITKFRSHLVSLSDKIQMKIAAHPDIEAERAFPVMVDGRISSPSFHKSLIGGFQFELSFEKGVAFDGQSLKAHASIENISAKFQGKNFGHSKVKEWRIQTFFNGNLIKDEIKKPFPQGDKVEIDFSTGPISSANQNNLEIKLFRKGFILKNKPNGKLSLSLPSEIDNESPEWLPDSTPSDTFILGTVVPPISVSAEDPFGNINLNSVKVDLVGTLAGGGSINQDVTNTLNVQLSEGDTKLDITGDINPIQDGDYELRFSGSDLGNNAILPDPLVKSFRIDATPPVLSTTGVGNFKTKFPTYNFTVDVSDFSAKTTTIEHNGVEIKSSSDDNFQVSVNLQEESTNKIEIKSIDELGNAAPTITLQNITLDTLPPVLSNLTPPDGTLLTTQTPTISLDLSDSGTGVNVSSVQIFLNGENKTNEFSVTPTSISGTLSEGILIGPNNLSFSVSDNVGNQTVLTASYILTVDPPIISLNPNDGAVLNNFQPSIFVSYSGEFLDTNTLEIKLDGLEITQNFQISETGAILFATNQLSLGLHTLVAKISNEFNQESSATSLFTVEIPAPPVDPPPPDPSEEDPEEKLIPFEDGDSIEITDTSSEGFGAIAVIPANALTQDTQLTVELADATQLPNINDDPDPPEFVGPSIRFGPPTQFQKNIVVGVPYDPATISAQGVPLEELKILQFDEASGEYRILEPFVIDEENGILYAETNSFSVFSSWWSRNVTLEVTFNTPENCIDSNSGKICEVTNSSLDISGFFTTTTTSSSLSCISCPNLQTINFDSINRTFSVQALVLNPTTDFQFRIRARSIFQVFDFKINLVSPIPPVDPPPPPPVVGECDLPKALCNFAGDGTVAFSPDGSIAKENPINIGILKEGAFGAQEDAFFVRAMDVDTQNRIVFVEPASTFVFPPPPPRGQDPTPFNQLDLVLRRVLSDGTLGTIANFNIVGDDPNDDFSAVIVNDIEIDQVNDPDTSFIVTTAIGFRRSGFIDIPIEKRNVFKIEPNGVVSELSLIGQIEKLALASDGTIYYYSMDSGGSGIYSFNQTTSVSTFLGGNPSPVMTSPDGTNISSFVGLISDIEFYNGELYITQGAQRCIRKFDTSFNVQTVAGECGSSDTPTDNEPALSVKLGPVTGLKVDPLGNIYFIDTFSGNKIRVVRVDNNLVQTLVGGGAQAIDLGPTNSLDVTLPIEFGFAADFDSNIFATTNEFVYRVADSLSDSQVTGPVVSDPEPPPPTSEPLAEVQLNEDTLIPILSSTQSQDGYWDFDEKYTGSVLIENDSERRLIATERALEVYFALGLTGHEGVLGALTWISNQEYESVSMVSKQLTILHKFKASAPNLISVKQAREKLLVDISSRFRPVFFGWGSDKFSVTNNMDSSEAIHALSFVHQTVDSNSGSVLVMTNFLEVVSKFLNAQFDSSFGSIHNGGWGFFGVENPPNLINTEKVVNALISYAKLPDDEPLVIAPALASTFINLRDNIIPPAIERALGFIFSLQRQDGSFGNTSQTASIVKLFNNVLNSGLITDPALIAQLNQKINDAIVHLNGKDLSILDLGELAMLTDNIAELNSNISIPTDLTPDSVPDATSLPTLALGSGEDGVLRATGTFNLNENASDSRSNPDGVALEVTNILLNTLLQVDGAEIGDLAPNDEILMVSIQGLSSVGNFEFLKVSSIDYTQNPVEITLASPTTQTFDSSDKIFIQRIPQYTDISPTKALTITASPWNGKTGGIVAFRSTGTISNLVSIDASGIGFSGGMSFVSGGIQDSKQGDGIEQNGISSNLAQGQNGCAGGNAEIFQVSGGGGSYGTQGSLMSGFGIQADNGEIFGVSDLAEIHLGCGGGSGIGSTSNHALSIGGRGGGIVLLFANNYEINGSTNSIKANGSEGFDGVGLLTPEMGAGGGSGGSILLNIFNGTISSGSILAKGGLGSMGDGVNAGHRGGDGRIRINYSILNTQNFPNLGSGDSGVALSSPAAFGAEFQ